MTYVMLQKVAAVANVTLPALMRGVALTEIQVGRG